MGILGAGKGGTSVYKTLKGVEYAEVVIVCDLLDNAPGMILASQDGIQTCRTIEEFCQKDIDVIIEATGLKKVQQGIAQVKSSRMSVMEAEGANLMMHLLEEKEKLSEIKHLQVKLDSILNSLQEAIEVADTDGTINYVNPSFSRVTGISPQQRIGQNIFEVSPHGALARVLRTHEPIFAHRAKVGGSDVEVVSNASPIIIEGKIDAGVVVFQPLTDIYKTMEQLHASTQAITELHSRISQLTTSTYTFDDIIGSHPDFERAITSARKAAKSNSTLLILGESGTGKELFAHAIHSASRRSDKPFIKVDCADIPETLLEYELFGHEKGAVPGALKLKIGKLELADGGTIFLDEIGDLNSYIQAKLAKFFQNKEFERVGNPKALKCDVRVIASTNRNLREMVRKGDFNKELFYYLNAIELSLPPLRKHKEDIVAYAQSYIVKLNRRFGKRVVGLNTQAEHLLLQYHWPGNVRELQNVIERAMVLVDGDIITPQQLTDIADGNIIEECTITNITELLPLDVLEKQMIRLALQRFGDSVEGKKKAALTLNISLATLYNKIKTL